MLRRARPLVPLAVVLLLAQALLGADCVDGVTPDCSGDAAAQCGPTAAGGGTDSSVPLPESGADTSAPVDSGTDASTADVVDASDAG
jgi:hypothetical protein